MNHILKKTVLVIAVVFLGIAMFAPSVFADLRTGANEPLPPYSSQQGSSQQGSQGATDVVGVLNRVFEWLRTILLALAAIFIVVAAFMYVTAGGNAETIKTANKMILYTVGAIVIALITQIIINVAKFFANG